MEEFRAFARVGSPLGVMFALLLSCGPVYVAGAEPDISGVYWASEYNAEIQLIGGGELPLTAE